VTWGQIYAKAGVSGLFLMIGWVTSGKISGVWGKKVLPAIGGGLNNFMVSQIAIAEI
jgi:hypothetical protein